MYRVWDFIVLRARGLSCGSPGWARGALSCTFAGVDREIGGCRARPREKGIRVTHVRASSRALCHTLELLCIHMPLPSHALALFTKTPKTRQDRRHTQKTRRRWRTCTSGVIGERHYSEFGSGKGAAEPGRRCVKKLPTGCVMPD